jgi:hypothetical protein
LKRGAHEDEAVEEGIAAMRNFWIGIDESHIVALIKFSDTVLAAGLEFLGFMVAKRGYRPRRFRLA